MRRTHLAVAGLVAAAAVIPITLTVSANADSITGDGQFYVDPDSNAAAWLEANPDSGNADLIRENIAEQAGAKWYGDWDTTPLSEYVAAAAEADQTPIVVAYNMYQRDCGGESGGGADSPDAYKSWIDGFATDLGDSDAVVIVEPDALAQLVDGCVPDPDTRRDLLSYAVNALSAAPNAQVYLDAGNADWAGTGGEVAAALEAAGVDKIRGFAMNTSNHYDTKASDDRAAEINAALSAPSHYVVDTSRNGSGKTQEGSESWCNPVGATLGENSTTDVTGGADAHLWVKFPGDSDGRCGYVDVPAGQFDEKLATALITGVYK